jgi:hypothetical protein
MIVSVVDINNLSETISELSMDFFTLVHIFLHSRFSIKFAQNNAFYL